MNLSVKYETDFATEMRAAMIVIGVNNIAGIGPDILVHRPRKAA
ncbi:hypothetical protein [Brevundimonas sp.]|nr:hypothetical protein [Brevundimonas sp.]HYC97213.1 hypothetical protein [Brevundimonas sp.]